MIIGILGSGQLGRMLAIAAAQLGIKTHIFAPDASTSPAGDIAFAATEAAYDAGWWFGVARGDWKALYLSFVSDYGEEQAESWRQSAISDNGCESIGDSPAE